MAAIAAKLAAQPRLGAWLTKQTANHVEELRGKRAAMDAKSMAAAKTRQAAQ